MEMNKAWVGLCAALLLSVCVGCGAEGEDDQGAPDDSEEIGSTEQALSGAGTNQAYAAGFGRPPTGSEISYWGYYIEFSASEMHQYISDWLRSSGGANDRRETIIRAYQTVYRRNPGPIEQQYWDTYVQGNSATFSELVHWLEDYGSRNRFPRTGTYSLSNVFVGAWGGYAYAWGGGNTYNVTAQ
jgi:hypothetical protein